MEEDIDSFSRALLQIQDTTFFNSFSIEAVIGLAVLLLLILLSAVISGSETAFFSLVPEKLKREKSQEPVNRLILKLLDKPQKLLATILISNNFINVGIVVTGVFISEQLFNLHMNPVLAFIIQVVLLTAVLLLFGEIMPKIYAANATLKFASFMARPLLFLRALFSPLSSLLVSSTRAIDKRIKRKGHEITMEDINSAIDLTRTAKQSPEEDEEQKILKGIAKFGNIEVKEIMKSRVDVVAIEESESFNQVLKVIKESGYSRIPVYRESFDNVQGIIYIKDFLGHLDEADDYNWNSRIRSAFFIPENKNISDLLIEFQDKKIHLAIVVDEYGGTSGVVTMEDIIEEIVGEIVDEFDVENDSFIYKKLSENEYLFEGKVSLNDFCKTMHVEDRIFDQERGEADTLAGFILEKQGEIPDKGTEVVHDKFTFIVQNVSDRRITRILVKTDEPGYIK